MKKPPPQLKRKHQTLGTNNQPIKQMKKKTCSNNNSEVHCMYLFAKHAGFKSLMVMHPHTSIKRSYDLGTNFVLVLLKFCVFISFNI